jgi:hypothetical protein
MNLLEAESGYNHFLKDTIMYNKLEHDMTHILLKPRASTKYFQSILHLTKPTQGKVIDIPLQCHISPVYY